MFDLETFNQGSFRWSTILGLALASDLAYQPADAVNQVATRNWGFKGCAFLTNATTQCFVAHSDAAIVVSFRGTEALNDWIANMTVIPTDRPYGTVHRGFAEAYDLVADALTQRILSLQPAGKVIHLTGHSLGGALATIAACEFRQRFAAQFRVANIATFGQPRLARPNAVTFLQANYPDNFHRFVYDDDVVTRIPPGYSHVGRLYHFDSDGLLQRSATEGDGGSTTETPAMSEPEFRELQASARTIQAGVGEVAGIGTEAQRVVADRSLEGFFPSVRDHRLSRYIAAIRGQLPRSVASRGNDAAVMASVEALEVTRGIDRPKIEGPPLPTPVQVRARVRHWTPPEGMIVNSQVGQFYSCLATRDEIGLLNADPDIMSVSISRELDPGTVKECAVSIPLIGADQVQAGGAVVNGGPPLVAETGDHALVGLIDTGIDILHQCFMEADGYTSRIEAIWVQRDTSGTSPKQSDPAFYTQDYGTLYNRKQIQDFVDAYKADPTKLPPQRLRDPGPNGEGGHGTHVASIATGRAVGTFGGGMAPDARIVVVVPYLKTTPNKPPSMGYSVAHQDALAFLKAFKQARVPQLPMVVNVSLGMNAGAHDGSSDTEKVFDAITSNGKDAGFVVVKSAGNERTGQGHTRVQMALGSVTTLDWNSTAKPRTDDYFEFWYEAYDDIQFTLIDPSGRRSQAISQANPLHNYTSQGNQISLELTQYVTDNGDNRLVVRVVPVEGPVQVGLWTLEMQGLAINSQGYVDGWVERNDDRPVTFQTGCTPEMTLSIPGTAGSVICVAASKKANPVRLIAASSYGPTRKGGPKPDLNAPGDQIIAAWSDAGDHEAVTAMTGTSMASPHVAGAVALVLSARDKKVATSPGTVQFNATQIAVLVRKTTENFQAVHNMGSGYGRLNALKFFAEASRQR